MTNYNNNPRFEIAADVVFRLGEELITDVVQALVELVKNSYDADATWAKVIITTPSIDSNGTYIDYGEILVEDDGHGMDEEALKTGWLTIANSPKKSLKDQGHTTKRFGRTPVGDKGLGRLGVQRLGYDVEIVSRTLNEDVDEIKLAFSWRDFTIAAHLSDVPVFFEHKKRSHKRSGTKIIVRNLKDPEQWKGNDARNRLQRSLSELISPFKEVRDFSLTVLLDGEQIPIAEIAEQIRDSASVRYKLSFDGSKFIVSGKVRMDFVERAQKKDDQSNLKLILRKDEGRSFYEFLINRSSKGRPLNFCYVENSSWFLSFEHEIDISSMGGVRIVDGDVANPGPFNGEVDYLLLDSIDIEGHIWDNLSNYRQYVSELAGIRVYRDGFGIRVGEDWLDLGKQSTSGGSLYGLRPKNVIGFIAISARENRALLETTSREGFQKTPNFLNFFGLLQQFVKWSGITQEYLRRGALEFLHHAQAEKTGIVIGREISSATDVLRQYASAIDQREQDLYKAENSMKQIAKDTQRRVKELVSNNSQLTLYHQDKLDELHSMLIELNIAITKIDKVLQYSSIESSSIEKAQNILNVVQKRDQQLRKEIEMFYEGVALGLTAEALSHEIATIADHLSQRASTLTSYIGKQDVRDAKIFTFIEHVRSSVTALRKQLSHLQPSMRYVRDKREIISISSILIETRNFFISRFAAHHIKIEVIVSNDFKISFNRGKLMQVLDNILLNSEYWLSETRRKCPNHEGVICIEISKPFIYIWDNGPGIASSVEDILFDPFVTTKEKGNGRGLGLFIVQQLLDSERCSVRLLYQRNKVGRRYKFEIELTGALND